MQTAIYDQKKATGIIRKINLVQDLDPVADLIELCFPLHLDPDGLNYLKEMRRAAKDMRLLGMLSSASELEPSRSSGFVWEEDGHIVGNLSLINLQNGKNKIVLIANVAVHPDYRRRGIAHQLTQQALSYLDKIGEKRIWLQVKEDNPTAIHLYQSFDFVEKARRTTWRIKPIDIRVKSLENQVGVRIRARKNTDWQTQETGLEETYPRPLRWNMPVSFRRFTPGLPQNLLNLLDGVFLRHWTLEVNGNARGTITWQKTNSHTNNLWLAFPNGQEDGFLSIGLRTVLKSLSKKHPLSIDYPQGRCEAEFQNLGFEHFRTLIWMNRGG